MNATSKLMYKMSPLKSNNSAQKRWRILARALTSSPDPLKDDQFSTENEEISVRRFTCFNLLHPVYMEHEADCTWLLYTARVDGKLCEILISWITKCFTPNELIGFNNTGNVCVWPSEECLAYYLLKNPEICRNRRVLELGGGMSCLAGVLAAKYCRPNMVMLTDGNPTSVANVRRIVYKNCMNNTDTVRYSVVQWEKAAEAFRETNTKNYLLQEFNEGDSYDVIICADCLFFDEARLDLVESIYGLLTDEGTALVVAPRRGSTFRKFTEAAIQRGFNTNEIECYDDEIWSRHLKNLATNLYYCPDLHFPVLLKLTKQKKLQSG